MKQNKRRKRIYRTDFFHNRPSKINVIHHF
nr:MAG TPA: hypothetical protein [Caudoviricetes sp.]